MGVHEYMVSGCPGEKRQHDKPRFCSDNLRTQFSESEEAVGRLTAGADVVRSKVANVK